MLKAKSIGTEGELNYDNDEGNPVYFEFIGVRDLINLGIESEENEVWFEIKDYLNPMERKDKFIPPEKQLCAIVNEAATNQSIKADEK